MKTRLTANFELKNYFTIIIFALATILRFWDYASPSLTNDELSALSRLRFNSFGEMLAGGAWIDGHPAGVQAFLYYWVKCFGDSAAAIRFPFVIASILTVFFAFKTAKSWFGEGAAMLTVVCIAFLQLPLLYGNLARPYSPAFMFVMLLAWCWHKVLFTDNLSSKNKRIIYSAGLTLSITGALYTHYFAGLTAIIAGITGLFYINKKNYIYYGLPYIIAALLFLPHLSFTLNHISLGGVEQWLCKPDDKWLAIHLFNFMNKDLLLILIILSTTIWFYYKNRKLRKRNSLRIVAFMWFLIPFLAGYLYSWLINSVLQDSVLLFSTPFIFFLAGSYWPSQAGKKEITIISIIALFIISSTIFKNSYYSKLHFTDFKGVAFKIHEYETKYEEKNIYKVFNINNPYYIAYYLGKDTSGTLQWINNNNDDLKKSGQIIRKSNKNFLLYARLKPGSTIINDIINASYPYLVEYSDFEWQAETFLYSKTPIKDCFKEQAPKMVTGNGFEGNSHWPGELNFLDTIYYKGSLGAHLKAGNEFGPTWKANSDTLLQLKGCKKIKAEAYILTKKPGELQLVISVENSEGTVSWWSSSRADYFAEPGQWSKFIHTAYPVIKRDDEIVKIYIWNPSKEDVYIDDFSISIY